MRPIHWAYGVTTVPERMANGLLGATLKSLAAGGFDKPWLFIDGKCHNLFTSYNYTEHHPPLASAKDSNSSNAGPGNAWGNWILGLWELYVRHPGAQRYALFQDDLVCPKNLRPYLDQAMPAIWGTRNYPESPEVKGYLNLYTCSQGLGQNNVDLRPPGYNGWYLSNQCGRGALALVFGREALTTMLSSPHGVRKTACPSRGWRCIDGGVCEAMVPAGYKEWVHWPSLVDHTGTAVSTMGNRTVKGVPGADFPGEEFDCLCYLGTASKAPLSA